DRVGEKSCQNDGICIFVSLDRFAGAGWRWRLWCSIKFTLALVLFRWQTLIGGLLLHVSWKLGWAEINSSSRSAVLTWLPASLLFVGIIYAGSRALSRLVSVRGLGRTLSSSPLPLNLLCLDQRGTKHRLSTGTAARENKSWTRGHMEPFTPSP
uniref:Uncharacterized protein n=1 Tax=Equus asinus asinus TaxID=83772 RepID=A0A8C4KYQ6_EQUAS